MADLDVTVRLRDALSRPLRQSRASINDLERSVEDLSRQLGSGSAEAQEAQRQLNALRRAAGLAERDFSDLNREISEHERRLRRAAAMNRLLAKTFKGPSDQGRILGKVISDIKIPALITGVTLAATAISGLGAAGIAGVAGLAPLVGLLGVLPALLTPLVALPSLLLGFSGIGEAFGVLSDPAADAEAIAAALEKLNPEARSFVQHLVDAKDQAAGLKDIAQAGMLPGFESALHSILPLLPVLEQGLDMSSRMIGGLASSAGAWVGGQGADLLTLFTDGTELGRVFGIAFGWILAALLDLTVVGGPLALQFAQWIGRGAEELARLTQAGRDSGELEAFLQRAADLGRAVGGVMWDLVVALFNVGRESAPLSDVMGGGLTKIVADFRAFTESVEGQSAIRAFFTDAIPLVTELGRVALDLVGIFGRLATDDQLVPVIEGVRTQILPALEALATGFSGNLGPALVDLAAGWLTFLNVLSFDPIVSAANAVGDIVTRLTEWVQLTPGASTGIATLLLAVTGLRIALVLLRLSGIGAVVMAIPSFVRGMRAGAIATTGMTTAQKIAIWTGRGLRLVMLGIAAAGKIMGKGLYAALGPIGLIILAVMAVVAAFTYFYRNNEGFRQFVDSFVDKIKIAWGEVVIAFQNAGAALHRTWEEVKIAWNNGIDALKRTWGEVVIAWNDAGAAIMTGVRWLVGLWDLHWAIVRAVVQAVWDWLVGAWDWVIGKIKTGLAVLKAGFDFYWNLIAGVVRKVLEDQKAKFDWWVAIIKLGISGFLTFWKGKFDEAKTKFDAIIDPLKEKFDGVWTSVKEKFGDFITALKGVTLPGWVQTLVDAIKAITDGIAGGVGKLRDFFAFGDAPAPRAGMASSPGGGGGQSLGGGRSAKGYTGTALARVQQMGLAGGLRISSTYRSPARNRAVGGSPTSLHMDRDNPAVDIAGPVGSLDAMARRLRAVGGWRQLLWRVAGHYDHIHVAHSGGKVEHTWGQVPGLARDERPAILQVGERVLSRAQNAAYETLPMQREPQSARLPEVAAAVPVTVGGGPNGDRFRIHVEVYPTEPMDVTAAVTTAVRKLQREQKERQQ